jgi:transposase-like protein
MRKSPVHWKREVETLGTENQPYDQQFKHEAVRLSETGGKSVAKIEADLGISSGLLNKWRAQLRRDGSRGFWAAVTRRKRRPKCAA